MKIILQGAAVGADTHLAAWEKTAGPKTPQGQAKASRNAYKGGTRPILRLSAPRGRQALNRKDLKK